MHRKPVKEQFTGGVLAALPVVLGYIPVGIAFGVLARYSGLSVMEILCMSLLVYAGASQLIAVEMLSAGVMIIPIIVTTFLVNLWHVLMSSSIAYHIGKTKPAILWLLSAELTDESFAVGMSDVAKIEGKPYYLLGMQITAHFSWVCGSVIGALCGTFIDSNAFGFPFAMTALFICLLILQIKNRIHIIVMLIAGISALVFKAILPGTWYILLAAVVAAGSGYLLDKGRNAGVG
jgi:4-azaleucine resistance transporter AzlC